MEALDGGRGGMRRGRFRSVAKAIHGKIFIADNISRY